MKRPFFSGLRGRLTWVIFVLYLVTGSAALAVFLLILNDTVKDLNRKFAVQYAREAQNRIMAPVEKELTLCRKLVDTPIIKAWARDEDNPALKAAVEKDLASFKRHFRNHSFFVALAGSNHYYFDSEDRPPHEFEPTQTLSREAPEDIWFFSTLEKVFDFDINVDVSKDLGTTLVWINTMIRDQGRTLGIAGTGFALDDFIRNILDTGQEGIKAMLLDRTGTIRAHPDPGYIDANILAKDVSKRKTIFRLLDSTQQRDRLKNLMDRLVQTPGQVETLNLEVENENFLAGISFIEDLDWYVLILINRGALLNPMQFAPLPGLLVLALLVIVVAIGWLLNRLVLTPLAQLTRSSEAIALGDYDQRVPTEDPTEIGDLARSFDRMAVTVKQHTRNLEQLVAERTEALTVTNQELGEKNQQILSSIQYAELIQRGVLPLDEDLAAHLDEYFVLWQPRDVVGGDLYYFRTTSNGFVLAVADCTGHGVPGAFMTMTTHSVLDRIIHSRHGGDPSAILVQLNRIVRETINRGRRDDLLDNGLDIGICRWFSDRNRLIFAGARISLLCQGPRGLETIQADSQSAGYRRSNPDFIYRNHIIEEPVGRTFYLATDGIADQAGGDRGFGFGRRRLKNMLEEAAVLPLSRQKDFILNELHEYQGNYPQRDDLTMVGFRLKPGPGS